MALPDKTSLIHEKEVKCILLLTAIALNGIEYFIPRIPLFPWLKPGLANIITIVWLIKYGLRETIIFAFLRIWIVTAYFGLSFFTLTLGLTGSIFSTISMGIIWRLLGKRHWIGTIGTAICGAFFHNLGQLLMVYMMMTQNSAVLYQLPLMVWASLLFGGIVGSLTPVFIGLIDNYKPTLTYNSPSDMSSFSVNRTDILSTVLILSFCISLLCISSLTILSVIAITTPLGIQFMTGLSIKKLVSPLQRFWMLFIFVGLSNLIFTPGMKVPWVPLVTWEGLIECSRQWLRIWVWLHVSSLLLKVHAHHVLFSTIHKMWPYHTTLEAAIQAVELFPEVFEILQKKGLTILKKHFRSPQTLVQTIWHEIVQISYAKD